MWPSRRSRNADSRSSTSAATRLTVIADTSPSHMAPSTSRTFRVLTPWKYISEHATSNARSLRCHRANIDGWYGSHPRTWGTAKSRSPTRVLTVRGLYPFRRPTRPAARSCGAAPTCRCTSSAIAACTTASSTRRSPSVRPANAPCSDATNVSILCSAIVRLLVQVPW